MSASSFPLFWAGLILDLAYPYHRRIYAGIRQFERLHPQFVGHVQRWPRQGPLPMAHQGVPYQGIIGFIPSQNQADELRQSGLPVVNVSNSVASDDSFARVVNDDRAIGAMAAEYFLSRGWTRFACHVQSSKHFSVLREEGFRRRLASRGLDCDTSSAPLLQGLDTRLERPPTKQLLAWLRKLTMPLAMFVDNDHMAIAMHRTLTAEGRRVPADVALLGVDDDEEEQGLEGISLSSVRPALEQVGYEAAASLLQSLESGAPPEGRLISPEGVIARLTTDLFPNEEERVTRAIRIMKAEACEGLRIDALAGRLAMSRRAFEIHFRRETGQSPKEMIQQIRLDEAKRLLAETRLPIGDVAQRCGFSETRRLSILFPKLTGMTPSEYRKRWQKGGAR